MSDSKNVEGWVKTQAAKLSSFLSWGRVLVILLDIYLFGLILQTYKGIIL